MARPSALLVTRPERGLRLLPNHWYKAFVVLLVVVWLVVPINLGDAWLDVLARCGVAAVAAHGLDHQTG